MKEVLAGQKVIPVLTLDNEEDGYFICQLLLDNGFNAVEITLRTEGAQQIAQSINNEFSDLSVGVGTVTTIKKMAQITDDNFAFAVSPGFEPAMVNMASIASMPFLPGITTITEAMNALSLDVKYLKFFPAELNGGVKILNQFRAVVPELAFCPTGGITIENIESYLNQDNVFCVGASDIAPKQLIKSRESEALKKHIQQYKKF